MNYLVLLQKYMEHVNDCEGVTFVDKLNSGGLCAVEFTEEEVEELKRLDDLRNEGT